MALNTMVGFWNEFEDDEDLGSQNRIIMKMKGKSSIRVQFDFGQPFDQKPILGQIINFCTTCHFVFCNVFFGV